MGAHKGSEYMDDFPLACVRKVQQPPDQADIPAEPGVRELHSSILSVKRQKSFVEAHSATEQFQLPSPGTRSAYAACWSCEDLDKDMSAVSAPGQRVEFGVAPRSREAYQSDAYEFSMCADRRLGKNIGVELAPLLDKTLMIMAIHSGGLADEWNSSRTGDNCQDVCQPGLRVVDVNGH